MEELDEPEKITEAHKAGLARMYADEDFRGYLMNRIKIENLAMIQSVKAGKLDDARDFASKMDSYKKLLEKGKAMYVQSEKLRSSTLEDLEKNKNAVN